MKRNIVITGTTRGIGQALNNILKTTDHVISLNRPDYDLTDLNTLSKLDFSDIDVLVLNAASWVRSPLDQISTEDIFKIVNSIMIGNLYLAQRYIQHRQSGVILHVSSSAAVEHPTNVGLVVYSAAKAGMTAAVRELRHELKSQGKNIRLIDVKPGITRLTREPTLENPPRVPSTYEEVANALAYAINHPTINDLSFNNL